MTGRMTTKGDQLALDACTGVAPSVTMYLALLTAAPAVAATPATITEYAATGYARQACAMTAGSAADPSVSSNTVQLTFGPLSGATGLTAVTHAALVSSASGTTGYCSFTWELNAPRTPAAGDSLQVGAGQLTGSQA